MKLPRIQCRIARASIPSLLGIGLIAACSTIPSSTELGDHPTWQRIPAWAQQRVQNPWWRDYNDAALNAVVSKALASNPELAVIAAKLNRADAQLKQVNAARLPRLNLSIGWRDGRRKEVDFGPYELAPWTGGGEVSWEVDLAGKLQAATRSARYSRDAAYWDVHAARLQLASRIASTYFLITQLNGDIEVMRELTSASKQLSGVIRAQSDAGIIADSRYREQLASEEQSVRALEEMKRLRENATIRMGILSGDSTLDTSLASQRLPHVRMANELTSSQLIASHPQLLAAEARVRSAFQLEKSAKLNLLPSFRVGALATGAGQSLSGQYAVWRQQVGPSLDIPIYDPARLARVEVRKAESAMASVQYRATVLNILGEIDSAEINFQSRRKQLASAVRETAARKRAYEDAMDKRKAGVVSDADPLTAKQQWLAAKLRERSQRMAVVNDHINLIKAQGGK